jgi:hypothetical protein
VNRRERRAKARRLTAGAGVKGKDKAQLRRILANQMLTDGTETPDAPSQSAQEASRLWTPPTNAGELIRNRIGDLRA